MAVMLRMLAIAVLASFVASDRPVPADRVSGYAGIAFGATAREALGALDTVDDTVESEAQFGALCGPHEAVIFQNTHYGRAVAVQAVLAEGRVAEITLMLEEERSQPDRPRCLALHERLVAAERRGFRAYGMTTADADRGWIAARRTELRFADRSTVAIVSKYWRAGGTCYAYIVYLPPGAPVASVAAATSF